MPLLIRIDAAFSLQGHYAIAIILILLSSLMLEYFFSRHGIFAFILPAMPPLLLFHFH